MGIGSEITNKPTNRHTGEEDQQKEKYKSSSSSSNSSNQTKQFTAYDAMLDIDMQSKGAKCD